MHKNMRNVALNRLKKTPVYFMRAEARKAKHGLVRCQLGTCTMGDSDFSPLWIQLPMSGEAPPGLISGLHISVLGEVINIESTNNED